MKDQKHQYNQKKEIIEVNKEEKFEEKINELKNKINIPGSDLYYLAKDQIITSKEFFEIIIDKFEKQRGEMKARVNIKSVYLKNIIKPVDFNSVEFKQTNKQKIKNYEIKLYDSIKREKKENKILDEFLNDQKREYYKVNCNDYYNTNQIKYFSKCEEKNRYLYQDIKSNNIRSNNIDEIIFDKRYKEGHRKNIEKKTKYNFNYNTYEILHIIKNFVILF